jgi:uncharacterized membrane protein
MSLQTTQSHKGANDMHESNLLAHKREHPGPKEESASGRLLTYALLTLLLLCVAAVGYIVLNPPMGEKFTEFYVLGPEEKAYNYPINLTAGQNGTVVIGIVNKEQEPVEYKLRIVFDNETLQEKTVPLTEVQSYKARFTFTPHATGERKKMEFFLYRKGNNTVYRNLHLWVDVKKE